MWLTEQPCQWKYCCHITIGHKYSQGKHPRCLLAILINGKSVLISDLAQSNDWREINILKLAWICCYWNNWVSMTSEIFIVEYSWISLWYVVKIFSPLAFFLFPQWNCSQLNFLKWINFWYSIRCQICFQLLS